MFYTRRTLLTRLRSKLAQHKVFRPLLKIAAGVHAANGMAHGVRPEPTSRARD